MGLHLLSGDDTLVHARAAALLTAAGGPTDRVDLLTDPAHLLHRALTTPALTGRRVVAVTGVEKADPDTLTLLAAVGGDVTVVARTSPGAGLPESVRRALPRAQVEALTAGGRDFPTRVRQAAAEHHVTLAARDTAWLVDRLGGDTAALRSLMRALALAGVHSPTRAQLDTMAVPAGDGPMWRVYDAVEGGDAGAAVHAAAGHPPVAVHAALATRWARLDRVVDAAAAGTPLTAESAAAAAGVTSVQGRSLRAAATRLDPDRVRRGWLLLAGADAAVKTGGADAVAMLLAELARLFTGSSDTDR